jgi:hypothetical protein
MAKRHQLRGNDVIGGPHGTVDHFENYVGPFGSDIRMSIKGPKPENRDEPGGDGPVHVQIKKGTGKGNG